MFSKNTQIFSEPEKGFDREDQFDHHQKSLAPQTETSSLKSSASTAVIEEELHKNWFSLASKFASEIKPGNIMAFGSCQEHVFTGKQAVDLICELAPQYLDIPKPLSRAYGIFIAEKLVNSFWLFCPCSLQAGRTRIPIGEKSNELDIDEISTMIDPPINIDIPAIAYGKQSIIKVLDSKTVLYRLTKDALTHHDLISAFFDELIQYLKDTIPKKQGKLMMKIIKKEDGIVSRRTLSKWLEFHLGVVPKSKEFHLIKDILVQRKVLKKLPIVTCFKFIK